MKAIYVKLKLIIFSQTLQVYRSYLNKISEKFVDSFFIGIKKIYMGLKVSFSFFFKTFFNYFIFSYCITLIPSLG